jgi:hypothetical protein
MRTLKECLALTRTGKEGDITAKIEVGKLGERGRCKEEEGYWGFSRPIGEGALSRPYSSPEGTRIV